MKGKIIALMCAAAMLSSCHIYKAYDRPEDISAEGLYRDTALVNAAAEADTANFGNVPWREVFTDPQLQAYIEQALANNADQRTALLNVESAKAALLSARLAYLPQLSLSPQGTLTNWNKGEATSKTYNIPVSASWQIDLFGQILNPKRAAQVSLKQARYNQQAVQTQLIASTANIYYTLLMLDRQLQITEGTAAVLKDYVETMEAMYDYGSVNRAGIEQSRASYAQVVASLSDLRQSLTETENAFCLILNEPAHAIERGVLEDQVLPAQFSVGVPLQLLSNRPDVQAAEMALAACYYNTNSARAAFYPQITLSGSAGWTNSSGAGIVNPGKLLANLIGSLTQPLFYRGANIARLRQAKAQEEQAKIAFQTTLLNAGNEVSNALALYQNTGEKVKSRAIQVNSARKAAEDTRELFNLGTSTYLEVLTAQQSYLSAQLSEASDTFDQMQAVINLYQALGGGRE